MSKKDKKPETTGEMVRSFLYAVLIALVFRSVAYEPFHIPSGSMLTTLYEGDYIFVSKLSYGYSRYSFPFGIDWFEGRKFFTEPERGDVVVFRPPTMPRTDYIKRIIGLPGDVIQVKNSQLYINDEAVKLTFVDQVQSMETQGPNAGAVIFLDRYEETLPNGVKHTVLNNPGRWVPPGEFDHDNTGTYTVPEGHYFMMGDNRDNSTDSRYLKQVGYVPAENLIGRADVIAVSFNGTVPIWKVWRWPFAFRNDRFFKDL